ncbi:MAG: hypothetical protein AB7F28_08340 [Candidatus Margulisiibacteriota bacterium]
MIYELLNDDIVVVSLVSGNYYNINQFPEALWQALESPVLFGDVVSCFPNSEAAITTTLNLLIEEGLLLKTEAAPTALPGTVYPELTPQVEKFSDIQNLLLVDPIHEIDETGWPAIAN